ncbi:50S ribosomal protein L24 [Butyrivibrio sp. MC2013]|uniref:50S ribosomal protein L24 n=1 Tax=Butyrivibrio sp. MC2013 TaxID=1280686 RepID=UPI00040214F6|nr:50S ribosomal protein L24 [Butyrivibrio sp. MC2013]
MSASKIKKGDTVRVIAGSYDDLGHEGKVLSVDTKNHKVVVEGINKIKKHQKPSMQNQNGGIIEVEGSIDISNVMLVVDGKTTRVGFKVERDENGKVVKKSRIAKATGEVIDVIYPSKKN